MRFVVVQIIIILLLFFFEIGSIFSDKGSTRELYINKPAYQSLNLVLNNDLSDFDATGSLDQSVDGFLKKWDIKGASVAVTQNGRLVYAKGFGYADVESARKMEPGNIFRIASVSKLITAVAIMQLAEQDKLKLDDKVFGPYGILNDSVYLDFRDPRVEKITVQDLLVHKSGWSGRKGDVMFIPHVIAYKMKSPLPVDQETTIRYALTKKLNYSPGSKYSYSNLGYAILGEVIEKVSGIEYEDYVKLAILNPLGISDMHIGNSFYEDKLFNEVRYYIPDGSSPVLAYNSNKEYATRAYGGSNIEVLGAAGGWVASPAELLKLVAAIDGFNTKPDILSQESINLMTNNGKKGREMFGWKGSDGYGTWWRTGTLSGSSAQLIRQKNGISWIIILNTTTSKNSRIHREVSRMMFQAINSVKDWPEHDLFYYDQPAPVPSRYLTRIESR